MQRVNTVSDNNINIVTSNAVYKAIKIPTELTNQDLNNITEIGLYCSNGVDSLINKPPVTGCYNNFIEVFWFAKNSRRVVQRLYSCNKDKMWIRYRDSNNDWQSWIEI